MEKIEKVLIAGAGAIGAMVAHQIQAKKGAVSILAQGERLERYKKNGFIVNGIKVTFSITDATISTNPDLIILACKYTHLKQVINDLRTQVGEKTLILSLLNGIDSETILREAFGPDRVPYAFIISTDAQRRGNNITYTQKGKICFGDRKNDLTNIREPVARIADFFTQYDIPFEIPENMIYKQWYKFMMNIGTNQPSCIARAPYRLFQAKDGKAQCPQMRELMISAMKEVVAVSQAENTGLTERDIDSVCALMDTLNPESCTSMCQDVLAGRKTEIDMFAPVIIALGKQHSIPTPVNAVLFQLIKALEALF